MDEQQQALLRKGEISKRRWIILCMLCGVFFLLILSILAGFFVPQPMPLHVIPGQEHVYYPTVIVYPTDIPRNPVCVQHP